jgi:DNA polymerase-3 subunit delta
MKDKIILIYGDEQFLINKKIDEIIDKDNTVTYDMASSSMLDVKEDLFSYSLFSNTKDILCKNCFFLKSGDEGNINLEVLGEILNKKIENRLILTIDSKVDLRKKEVKEIIRIGTVYEFNKLKDYEIVKYISEEFKKLGYKIEISTVNYFKSFVGDNIGIINSEIYKLDLYKDNKVITKEDINAISSKTTEDNIFELIDTVVNKDIDKSLKIYDDFLLLNIEEIRLVVMLADQFRLIFQTKTLYSSGYTEEDIIKQLGVHPYRIKLAKQSIVSIDDAKRYIMKLYDLDVAIKTGKKEKKSAFKMFLLDV